MKKPALYLQIHQQLLQEVLAGQWPAGACLPTEAELAERYGTSRITSRHALSLLADEGYIKRVQGKGSVVVEKPSRRPIIGLALSGFDALFGMDFIKGVFHKAEELGYLVVMQTGYQVREQEGERLDVLAEAGVQGIISVPLYDSMHYTDRLYELSEKMPLVFADRRVAGLSVPLVCTDNVMGTRKLYARLCRNGYQRIGFISSKPDSTAVSDRLKGYMLEASAGDRVPEKRRILTSVRSTLPGLGTEDNRAYDIARIEQYLQDNRDIQAIIAHTYQVAKLVQRALLNSGLRVPEDCALVCFDAPRISGEPAVYAHMRQNEYEMGMRAVRCLIDQLNGKAVPENNYVDAVFIEGESYLRRAFGE